MGDEDIVSYLTEISRRLEALANVLSVSATLSSMSSVNEPHHIKWILDCIIRDELIATASQIAEDLKGEE